MLSWLPVNQGALYAGAVGYRQCCPEHCFVEFEWAACALCGGTVSACLNGDLFFKVHSSCEFDDH